MNFDLEYIVEFFEYLDDLRLSGVTNMFGAESYLQEEFQLEKKDARNIHIGWMNTFDDTPVESRAKEYLNGLKK